MNDSCQKKQSCVPYQRMWIYLLLTIPIVTMIGFTAYILFTFNYVFTILYAGFYFLVMIFQSYYCYFIDCPYVGHFCPAIAGIIPASFLAKLLEASKMKKNKLASEISASLAAMFLLAVIGFPLYWLFQYNIIAFVVYLAIIIIYTFVFLLTICPACASQDDCPGGITSKKLRRIDKKQEQI